MRKFKIKVNIMFSYIIGNQFFISILCGAKSKETEIFISIINLLIGKDFISLFNS